MEEQHKEVKFYLKKEDYAVLKELASKHNMTVKDFILKFIKDVKTATQEGFTNGLYQGI